MTPFDDNTLTYNRLLALKAALDHHDEFICGGAPDWFVKSFLTDLINWIDFHTSPTGIPITAKLRHDTECWLRGIGRGLTETESDEKVYSAFHRFQNELVPI